MTKTVIVTGATRGIGKQTALLLAQQGYNIVVSARGKNHAVLPGSIEDTLAEMKRTGADALGIRADMTSMLDIRRLVDTTIHEFGRLDAVVNNAAATNQGPVRLIDYDLENWEWQFDVNVHGPFKMMQVAAPRMAETGGGVVINLASNAGDYKEDINSSLMYGVAYAASKAAIMRLTNAVAGELLQLGVTAINVDPGSVRTELVSRKLDQLTTEHRKALVSTGVPAAVIAHLIGLDDPTPWAGRLLRAGAFLEEQDIAVAG